MSSDLPIGWVSAQLDQVFEPRSLRVPPSEFPESPYVGMEHVEAHTNRLLGTVEASTMSSSAARFYAGDVLYGRMRPYLNKVISPNFDGLASAEFIVFPAIAEIDKRFLLWRLSSNDFVEFACSQYEGDRPRVKFEQLGKFELLVPPATEQARIVEKLEELLSDLDAGVAELKAAQRKLAQYRQSLLKAAVEGALTADWRAARYSYDHLLQPSSLRKREARLNSDSWSSIGSAHHGVMDSRVRGSASQQRKLVNDGQSEAGADLLQRILTERRARWETRQLAKFTEQGKTPPKDWQTKYPEPVAPDTSDLPALPDGWTWASVDQCALDEASITDGPFGSNLKSVHYTESGPRVLRLQNIGDGHFVNAKAHISEDHYETLAKHAVAASDVIVAMLGEILPRACIVPDGIAPAIVKADCARIRLNTELLLPALLNANLNAEPTRKRVARLVKGIGRPRVNLGNLRSIPIPVPPVAEQIALCDALKVAIDSADEQEESLQQGFRLIAAQRKNILKAAFAGQLLPQDPNDEPASVLLERIRGERAAQGTSSKKRGRTLRTSA